MPPAAHNVQSAAVAPSPGDPAARTPAPEGEPIAADLPCTGCGYNLRGLAEGGRCPECGLEVAPSISADEFRRARRAPPDPKWARQIAEGAWLSLAVFGLVVGALLAPDEWYRLPYRNAPLRETPGRIAFLVVASGWWTLAWASAWKLTAKERFGGHLPPRALLATIVRSLATAYLLAPVVWAWATRGGSGWGLRRIWLDPPYHLILVGLMLCGVLSGFGLLVRVGQLMRRRKAWISMVEAWLLAMAVPGLVMYAAGVTDGGPSSLTLLFDLPVYPYGMPVLYEELIVPSLPTDLNEPLLWVYLAAPVWSALLFLRLALRYRAASAATDLGHQTRAPPSEQVV